MQSPKWYYNRLQTMSAGEIAWRVRSKIRDLASAARVARGWTPSLPASHATPPHPAGGAFTLATSAVGCWIEATGAEADWRDRLVTEAENVLAGKLSFFDIENRHLGDPVAWHKDQNTGVEPALTPIFRVDYRRADQFGDCKLVWEPNRHHQLVILGRAYRATGDERFARGVIDTIDSWSESNPYGYGMNWRSPLELGIRVINWVWALDLIREAEVLDEPTFARIRLLAYQHCFDITAKFSRGSSANNHLIGEAAGAFIGTTFFGFDSAWIDESAAILEHEALAQTFADGATREQAIGYEYFVLQFTIACIVTGRLSGHPFSDSYVGNCRRMIAFLLTLGAAGPVPLFGDYDDGYVLDLGSAGDRTSVVRAMALAVDDNAEGAAGPASEAHFWLNVEAGGTDPGTLRSVAFTDSGYYLLQQEAGRASAMFDCGNLGFTSIAAHGHADALSFTLRLAGQDILIDPGTYDYFTYPEWRNHFRSTASHNTIEVDGEDQSVMSGPFMWNEHAESLCERWEPTDDGGTVSGLHRGYTRLSDPVTHTRTLTMERGLLRVVDRLDCAGQHDIRLFFHFDRACKVLKLPGGALAVDAPHAGHVLSMTADPLLETEILTGAETPRAGWQSPGYHMRLPSPTLIGSLRIEGTTELTTLIRWE